MPRLILPNQYVSVDNPLIFLAGPMRGAPLWQDKAIEIISSKNPDIYIASPSKKLRTEYILDAIKGDDTKFSRQTNWEAHYIEYSSKNGAVIVWLPAQVFPMPINKRTGFPKPYARDTRGEYGELRGSMKYDKNIRFVVGYEENFDGWDVAKENFLRVSPNISFYSTLEDTCEEAVRLANLK